MMKKYLGVVGMNAQRFTYLFMRLGIGCSLIIFFCHFCNAMFNTEGGLGYEVLYVLIVFTILLITVFVDVGPYYEKFAFVCNVIMFLTLLYSVLYDFI